MGLPILFGGGAPSRFQIPYSVRLRRANSAGLTYSPTAGGNRKTYTVVTYFKRASDVSGEELLSVNNSGSDYFSYRITGNSLNNRVRVVFEAASNTYGVESTPTSAKFFDPTGWCLATLQVDTTQAVLANRTRLWIWDTEVPLATISGFSNLPQNLDTYVNSTLPHAIGFFNYNNSGYADCNFAHVRIFDGQALPGTAFCERNALTGQPVPKRYTGTVGPRDRFYDFSNATSTTTIGHDASGNGLHATTQGISVTAGVTFDQSLDTPTTNHSTVNPINTPGTNRGTSTTSNANTTVTHTDTFYYSMRVLDQPVQLAPIYIEGTILAVGSVVGLCVIAESVMRSFDGNNGPGGTGLSSLGWYRHNYGIRRNNGADTSGLSTFTTSDTVMIALDPINGRGWFGKAGTGWDASGNPSTGANPNFTFTPGTKMFIGSDGYNSASIHWNTGQRPYVATPPSGFLSLNTANLPVPPVPNAADAYMETLYAGNSSTQAIPSRFQPNSIRQKALTVGRSWRAQNSVRGFNLVTNTDTTAIEIAGSSIASVSPTAINLQNADNYNTTGENYLLQAWRTGALYGFDIVVYTGNGSTQNIAHGLGAIPHYIEVKKISGAAQRWCLFHRGFGAARYGYLNENIAFDTANANLRWGNNTVTVEPTSSVFTVGNSDDVNSNGNLYVAFVYTSIPGLSAFPDYLGNSSATGPWVDLGFKPRTLTIKDGAAVSAHRQFSLTRQPFNGARQTIYPNSAAVLQAENFVEIYACGFRPIVGAGNGVNDNGNRHLVTAFAEAPFKYAVGA